MITSVTSLRNVLQIYIKNKINSQMHRRLKTSAADLCTNALLILTIVKLTIAKL